MSLVIALALQAAAPLQSDPAVKAFDLKNFVTGPDAALGSSPTGRCVRDDPDDILVCGTRNRNEAYRIRPLPQGYGTEAPLVAEIGLFGSVKGGIRLENVAMPDGQISKRIMIGIRAPF